MSLHKKRGFVGLSVAGLTAFLVISGCSHSNNDAATANASSPSAPSSPSAIASQTPSSQPDQAKLVVSVPVKPVTADQDSHKLQIKEIYKLAAQGRVSGTDFVSGKTLLDKVHEMWGKPDKPIQAGDSYETYSLGAGKGTFAFGVGRGGLIYDIRTFGPTMDPARALNQISFSDIQKTLGKPTSVRKISTDDILVYKRGIYELKFVGPHATGHLGHISVYSAKAAKPMGAN